jgi:hypothetical protein
MVSENGLKAPPPPAIVTLVAATGLQTGIGLGLGEELALGLGLGDGLVLGEGLGLGDGLTWASVRLGLAPKTIRVRRTMRI